VSRTPLREALDALAGVVGLIQLIEAREPELQQNHRFIEAQRVLALSSSAPPEPRFQFSREWCERAAQAEADAGHPDITAGSESTFDQAAATSSETPAQAPAKAELAALKDMHDANAAYEKADGQGMIVASHLLALSARRYLRVLADAGEAAHYGGLNVDGEHRRVAIAGERMERSIDYFQRACELFIGDEQGKANPDAALIGLLCDAVRLSREYVALAAKSEATR